MEKKLEETVCSDDFLGKAIVFELLLECYVESRLLVAKVAPI